MAGEQMEPPWMTMLREARQKRVADVADLVERLKPLPDDGLLEQLRDADAESAEEKTKRFLEEMRKRKVKSSVEVKHPSHQPPVLTPRTSTSQGDEEAMGGLKRAGPPMSPASKRVCADGGTRVHQLCDNETTTSSTHSRQAGMVNASNAALQANMGLTSSYGQGQDAAPASESALVLGLGVGPVGPPSGSSLVPGQDRRPASDIAPMLNPHFNGWPGAGLYMPGGLHQLLLQGLSNLGMQAFPGGYGEPLGASAQSPMLARSELDQRSRIVASTPGLSGLREAETPPRTGGRKSSRAPSTVTSTPTHPMVEPLAMERRLPLRLWVPREDEDAGGGEDEADGSWREEEDMPQELRTFLQQALYSKICDSAKASKWSSLGSGADVCVLVWCVTRENKSNWTGQQARSACKTCTASWDNRRGRRPESRPCGRLMEGKVAILPLPKEERMGQAWSDKGFWVNRAG